MAALAETSRLRADDLRRHLERVNRRLMSALKSVGDLANIARVGIATASYHVARLAQAGLVEVRPFRNRRIVCLTSKELRLRIGV